MFEKDMVDKLQGLDKFKEYQEKKLLNGDVDSNEYDDIQERLTNLNAGEPERIQLAIMFEMLKAINRLNDSIQELNEDTNY